MKYHLKIGENTTTVTTGGRESDGSIQVTTEQEEYDIAYRPAGDHRYLLSVNGKDSGSLCGNRSGGKADFPEWKDFPCNRRGPVAVTAKKKKRA